MAQVPIPLYMRWLVRLVRFHEKLGTVRLRRHGLDDPGSYNLTAQYPANLEILTLLLSAINPLLRIVDVDI